MMIDPPDQVDPPTSDSFGIKLPKFQLLLVDGRGSLRNTANATRDENQLF